MDFQYIMDRLAELRVPVCVEEPVLELFDLTLTDKRIICMQYDRPIETAAGSTSGRSFWIHTGSGIVVVGLWSGMIYRIGQRRRLPELVCEVMSNEDMFAGRLPTSLPDAVRASYHAVECKGVRLLCSSAPDRLDDAAVEHTPTIARDAIVECLHERAECRPIGRRGHFAARIGGTLLIGREASPEGNTLPGMPLLIDSEDSDRQNMVLMLRLLVERLGCRAFDDGWGNEIDFDDPYYAESSSDARPLEPVNPGE